MRAWEKGLKGVTIFRDGCARIPILSTDNKEESESNKEVQANKLERGMIIKVDNNTVGKIKINNQIIVKEINGMLQIQAPLGYKEGFVYNINGMLIGKFDISTGNAYVSLPAKGVYIISIGDDRTKIIR